MSNNQNFGFGEQNQFYIDCINQNKNSIDFFGLTTGSLPSRKVSIYSLINYSSKVMLDGQPKVELTPEIVRKLYWEEKKSLPKIARIFKISYHEKIRRLMLKHKIPLRSREESHHLRKFKISKEEVYELYWKKGMKLKTIGKLFGVTGQTILRLLKEYKIPRRTYSEARALQRRKVSSEELKHLYLEGKMPLWKLARYIKTRIQTTKGMLQKLEIPIRTRGEAMRKYEYQPFSGDIKEKAYLIGIRVGDFYVAKDGKSIVVSVGSSHPAMIKLFHELFDKYGHCWEYPHKTKFGYDIDISCRLDSSFEFLLDKTDVKTPTQHELFLSFLAGYADAEGCWKTTRGSKGHIEFRFELESQDLKILEQIYSMLIKFGFTPRFYLTKRKGSRIGTFISKKDMYRVSLLKRTEAIRLAQILLPFIKHREKIEKVGLLLKVREKKKYEEIKEQVSVFKSKIKEEVIKFQNSAEMELNRIYDERGLEYGI